MVKKLQKMAAHVRRNAHEYVAIFAILCAWVGVYGSMQQSDERMALRDANVMAAR